MLEDKVAIVTGGGGGIGKGIALALARQGAHIVVSDMVPGKTENAVTAIRDMGGTAIGVAADVSKKPQCKQLIADAFDAMGVIDILVCAAGVGGFTHRAPSKEPLILENISEEDWDITLNVNLKGVFLCNQAVAPHFRKQGQGRIINISSAAGRKAIDWLPHYSASKAGVISFSQSVALQLAPFGVTVNVICPGVIRTAMWDQGAKLLGMVDPRYKGLDPDQVFQSVVADMVPMKRPQSVADIGHLAAFLSSDLAKEITGQVISVDGGAYLR